MRPLILSPLFSSVESLPFVGEKTAARLQKLVGTRVINILWSLPTQIETRAFLENLTQAPSKSLASVYVSVEEHLPSKNQRQPYKVLCQQEDEILSLVFFHAKALYLQKNLPIGKKRLISGLLENTPMGYQMVHPDYIGDLSAKNEWEGIRPLYGLTAGISQNGYRKIMKGALGRIPDLPEWIPPSVLDQHKWTGWKEAMTLAHQPLREEDLAPSSRNRERLAFDEFLAHQVSLSLFRKTCLKKKGKIIKKSLTLVSAVQKKLPFDLTRNQSSVLETLSNELENSEVMMRLLQGDVGSGKTVVALLAMVQAVESGAQCALLAPTEILAQQHYETLKSFLQGTGVTLDLFLGKTSKKEKVAKQQDLETGKIQIAIGTHALLEEGIRFQNLGFVVIDEQHRFGVDQRQKLIQKGEGVNVLIMSATPIPRSMALTLYGDLDISLLTEKPKDRAEIQTKVLPLERLPEVHESLKRAVKEGQKVYWVCPLIEESEALDLGHAQARFNILKNLLGVERVDLLHGRMSGSEKEAAMKRFKEGEISVLVSTTVIEVGVDISDATIMIIEHAERFGLSQLHQLRGRVGRGNKPSTCLLLYGKSISETGQKRLKIIRSTEDGFLIAEEDMKLRGAGDLLGTKQSGLPDFKIASLETQGHLLKEAYFIARDLVEKEGLSKEIDILLSLFKTHS
ncbi:ATP-dependent DNA helicase RecG [Alphaproteobacteria bacterium]|nr:ATP-dependent DNA helicase RecG [Alphaproteobacteria bacterium]